MTQQAAMVQSAVETPEPGIYGFDTSHSSVGFVARHLMVTKVRGGFRDFGGTIVVGETPETSSVEVAMKAASIDSGDAKRDEHLRSPDFFDAASYPELVFRSTRVRRVGETELEIEGELTIKEVTRPVTLAATFEGIATTPWGSQAAAFTASTEINREDWDLTWNVALESGGVLVGKKIKIEIEVQLVKQ